jgi:hypothetical protein
MADARRDGRSLEDLFLAAAGGDGVAKSLDWLGAAP